MCGRTNIRSFIILGHLSASQSASASGRAGGFTRFPCFERAATTRFAPVGRGRQGWIFAGYFFWVVAASRRRESSTVCAPIPATRTYGPCCRIIETRRFLPQMHADVFSFAKCRLSDAGCQHSAAGGLCFASSGLRGGVWSARQLVLLQRHQPSFAGRSAAVAPTLVSQLWWLGWYVRACVLL